MPHKSSHDVTVELMAQSLLKLCVRDVKSHLKIATNDWRSNDEGVHRLRVSLRRALACLDLFSVQVFVAKEARWLQKSLKELLKSAGKARDLDVLLAREMPDAGKASSHLRKVWKQKRKDCQKPLNDAFETLIGKRKLQTKTRALLKAMSDKKTDAPDEAAPSLTSWTQQQLRSRIEVLLRKLPDGSPLKEMHAFRISAKQLRYVTELLLELQKDKTSKQLLKLLEDVQKKLGRLQDEAVAAKSVARHSSNIGKKQGKDLQHMSDRAKVSVESQAIELSSWLSEKIVPALNRIVQSLEQSDRPKFTPAKVRLPIKRSRAAT